MGDVNYLGAITLGRIHRWEDKKASTITPISFPGKDAGNVEAIDTLGIIAYINFAGRWTGNFYTIQGYITQLKGIADGQQTSTQNLKSPFVNSRDENSVIRSGTIAVNTSVTSNKLVDTAALFSTSGIQVGDIVKNLTTGLTTTVSAIDSETTLSLAADRFPASGTSYACTATITAKVTNIEIKWELPGLSYCDYQISIVQSK